MNCLFGVCRQLIITSLRHMELLLYCAGPAARYCLSAVLTCPNIGTRARSGSYSAVVSCGIMISNADACMSTSHSVETICMSKQVNKALHNIMKCVCKRKIYTVPFSFIRLEASSWKRCSRGFERISKLQFLARLQFT